MTNIELLKALSTENFKYEDGEPLTLTLLPRATEEELQLLATAFPNQQIPAELRDLLLFARGWKDLFGEIVELCITDQYGYEHLLPWSINVGMDGLGNCWLLEIKKDGSLGKVFFACHDPAVLVIAANSLNEYLHQRLEHFKDPERNPIGVDHPSTGKVYLSAPNVIDLLPFYTATRPIRISSTSFRKKSTQWPTCATVAFMTAFIGVNSNCRE